MRKHFPVFSLPASNTNIIHHSRLTGRQGGGGESESDGGSARKRRVNKAEDEKWEGGAKGQEVVSGKLMETRPRA